MKRRYLSWIIIFSLGWIGWLTTATSAQSLFSVAPQRVEAQLVSPRQAIQPGQPFQIGLHLEIEEGWHTYWRNPGDSGGPPQVDWTLPTGFTVGDFHWPPPDRIPVGPLMNYGYDGSVLLVTELTPPANLSDDQPVAITADVKWLVCRNECIPETTRLYLKLPVFYGDAFPTPEWATYFQQTQQTWPLPSPGSATLDVADQTLTLNLDAPELAAGKFEEVAFFPYIPGLIDNAAPQSLAIEDNRIRLTLQRGDQPAIHQIEGVLVIEKHSDEGLVTQSFEIMAQDPSRLVLSATVWQTFLLAFLGGVILNLMPCVFPILSLKALSIAQKAQTSPQQARWQSVVYTAGILVSVGILSGVLLMLKALGYQVGWGFQLQSPSFILILIYVLFAVGLSLSGVFTLGASWMGVGQRWTMQEGYRGDFFTGVLATIVATPCTAPFMATAIGVALTQPVWVAFGIFQLLGLGLAFPYLVLGFTPALHRRLPKPGVWMETLQQFLAFPVYGAVAWLIWILVQQTGSEGLVVAQSGILLVALAVWIFQTVQLTRSWIKPAGTVLTVGLIGIALSLMSTLSLQDPALPSSHSTLTWEPFSESRLAELRLDQDPVFVNVSAAWCVTCLVNDRVVFSQPAVKDAFAAHQITLLKADWTTYDPAITQQLHELGRSGVPAYVFYGSDAEAVILPPILSVDRILTLLG